MLLITKLFFCTITLFLHSVCHTFFNANISWNKTFTTVVIYGQNHRSHGHFLGMCLDTVDMSVSLPSDKLLSSRWLILCCRHNLLHAYGYFSFCLISCIKGILKNRTNNFSVETSFCQFSNMASSGLKEIFFRLEEAMFENWQKLVSTEKLFVLFLRISLIHNLLQFHWAMSFLGKTQTSVLVNIHSFDNCVVSLRVTCWTCIILWFDVQQYMNMQIGTSTHDTVLVHRFNSYANDLHIC